MIINFKINHEVESVPQSNNSLNDVQIQLISSPTKYPSRVLADMLGIGRTKLFRMLRGEGLLDESNRPTKEYVDDFEIETKRMSKKGKLIRATRITEQGLNKLPGILCSKVDTYKVKKPRPPKKTEPDPLL